MVDFEGAIGAGKSQLCVRARDRGYRVIFETVEDNKYLSLFYTDMKKYALPMQIFLLAVRFGNYHRALREKVTIPHSDLQEGIFPPRLPILDRSIWGDWVFGNTAHELGNISDDEWQTYLTVFETVKSLCPPCVVVIFLQCSIATLDRRGFTRSRGGENIPGGYHRAILDSYAKMQAQCEKDKIPWFNIPYDEDNSEDCIQYIFDTIRSYETSDREPAKALTEDEVKQHFIPIQNLLKEICKEKEIDYLDPWEVIQKDSVE
jgi:deoxyadenosine/deoxycytidine kinase